MFQILKKNSLLFFIPSLLLFLSSCEKEKEVPIRHVNISIVTMQPETIPANFEFVGFTKSSHPVDIYARVQGYLDEIGYIEGDMVEKGESLFQLDPRQYIAAVDSAKGLLSKEEAILWNARVTRERLEPLYEKHAASRRDLDNAIAAQLASEASVQSAKANLIEAELNLSYTTILSPISGLSGRAKFRTGTLITPGENALLTTISVLDPIWVDFNVPSNDILRSRDEVGKSLLQFPADKDFVMELTLADGTTFPYKGKSNFASPTLDERTGTMLVRAYFPNPEQTLKPGEFVRVKAMGAVRPNSLFVPQSAVLESKSGTIVYVVNAEGKAEMQPIKAGDWYGNSWVVQTGLKPGDRVIVEGVNKVQPGTLVNITKEQLSTDPSLIFNQQPVVNATKKTPAGQQALTETSLPESKQANVKPVQNTSRDTNSVKPNTQDKRL